MVKPGDKVWLPYTVADVNSRDAGYTAGHDGREWSAIPDITNLPAIASFLNDHPETGGYLNSLLIQSPSPHGSTGREQRRLLRRFAAVIGGAVLDDQAWG